MIVFGEPVFVIRAVTPNDKDKGGGKGRGRGKGRGQGHAGMLFAISLEALAHVQPQTYDGFGNMYGKSYGGAT